MSCTILGKKPTFLSIRSYLLWKVGKEVSWDTKTNLNPNLFLSNNSNWLINYCFNLLDTFFLALLLVVYINFIPISINYTTFAFSHKAYIRIYRIYRWKPEIFICMLFLSDFHSIELFSIGFIVLNIKIIEILNILMISFFRPFQSIIPLYNGLFYAGIRKFLKSAYNSFSLGHIMF